MKKKVLAALMVSSSLVAQESALIKGLDVEVAYGVYTNVIDRGESLTANHPTGVGEIGVSYSGFSLGLATFGAGGVTEVDATIGYTFSGIDNLEIGAQFLSITTSSTATGGAFSLNADMEASVAIAYEFPDVITLGVDIMANVKDNSFVIYQGSLAKSFGDLGVEALFAQKSGESTENQFMYYQLGATYPCAITGGEWGVAIANTTKSDATMTYMVSHSFTF